jgi:hypothetical protein
MEMLKKRTYRILIAFSLIIQAGNADSYAEFFLSADSLDKTIIKDFTDDWLVFNGKYNAYVPYLDSSRDSRTISVKADLEKFRDYSLNFIAYPGVSMFVNNKLYYANPDKRVYFVRFALKTIPPEEFKTEDLITFYNAGKGLPLHCCYIGQNANLAKSSVQSLNAFSGILKRQIPGDNIFIVLFLIIIFLFGLIKSKYPKRFREFYNFSRIFPSSSPEDKFNLEIHSIPSILFILINACSWCLLLGTVAGERHTLFGLPYASLGGILLVSGLTIGVYYIKYIYLTLLAGIFNLRQIISIQFFELIKISLKLNLLCVPLAVILFYSRSEILEIAYKYFLYSLILCGLIVLVRISFLIFKYSGFRNIYLFSYLCTTEILPLIIIIKVILF